LIVISFPSFIFGNLSSNQVPQCPSKRLGHNSATEDDIDDDDCDGTMDGVYDDDDNEGAMDDYDDGNDEDVDGDGAMDDKDDDNGDDCDGRQR
jgi:hypothetical protein